MGQWMNLLQNNRFMVQWIILLFCEKSGAVALAVASTTGSYSRQETITYYTCLKGEAVDYPSNYRSIAVVPIIAKVLEKIVSIQLSMNLEEHHFLHHQQKYFIIGSWPDCCIIRSWWGSICCILGPEKSFWFTIPLPIAFCCREFQILVWAGK